MGIGVERLGIVDHAQSLARRFAERHPSLKRRILGMAPDYSNAKVALINVDVRTGERRIDRFIDPAPVRRIALVAIPKPAAPTPPPVRPFHWTQCREDFRAKEMHGMSGSCLRLRDILEIVAGQAGIEASRLTSDEQCQVVARPRQVSVLLACEFRDDLTYPQLGFLYNRHHTSIIHAKERAIAQMRRGDESMIALYERSKAEITAEFFTQEREAA